MTATELQHEALQRATSGATLANYPTIYQGFLAKGIPEVEILPRENVFTFHAWKALGRQVKKGEHGVRVATIRKEKATDAQGEPIVKDGLQVYTSRPWSAVVFHISQTQPLTRHP